MRISVDTAVDSADDLRLAAATIQAMADVKQAGAPVVVAQQIARVGTEGAAPAPIPPPPAAPIEAGDDDDSAASAVPPPPNAAPEYDSAGWPYDARIHTKTRAKKMDGTWKLAKGIDKDIVAKVTEENTGRRDPMHTGAALPPAPPPPVSVPPAPAPGAPPAAGAPSVPGSADAPMTFVTFMKWLTPLRNSGKLAADTIASAMATVGLTEVRELTAHPGLIADVHAYLSAFV